MARSYTLKRRAEQQQQTRQRIVEAAVDLHSELGPARTSLSMVADRAGVQRNTLYAHFPDERSLLLACSALSLQRDPLPDPAAWPAIKDREQRLVTGLEALYSWFARNAQLAGCVLRDAEAHEPTRDIVALRFAPLMAQYQAILGKSLNAAQTALLRLALSYSTWRSLTQESGLSPSKAARLMARTVIG